MRKISDRNIRTFGPEFQKSGHVFQRSGPEFQKSRQGFPRGAGRGGQKHSGGQKRPEIRLNLDIRSLETQISETTESPCILANQATTK